MLPKPCRVEDHVGEYISSKIATREGFKQVWPLLQHPYIERERQRRLLILTEDDLEKRKQLYIEQKKFLNQQWNQVGDEGDRLKENFIKFNEFLNVNRDKRRRAEAGIIESKKFRSKVEEDVERLKTKLIGMKQSKNELDLKIRDHYLYEKFLGQLIGLCGKEEGFKNESDIVERYEYYAQLNFQLAQQQEKIFAKLQHAKSEMSKLTENANMVILGLRTTTITLQGRYEEASRKSRQLESLIIRIRDKIRQRMEDIELVKSASWNLYNLICKRKNVTPKVRKDNIEEQLLVIKETLSHLRKTSEQLNKKLKQSKSKKKLLAMIG